MRFVSVSLQLRSRDKFGEGGTRRRFRILQGLVIGDTEPGGGGGVHEIGKLTSGRASIGGWN